MATCLASGRIRQSGQFNAINPIDEPPDPLTHPLALSPVRATLYLPNELAPYFSQSFFSIALNLALWPTHVMPKRQVQDTRPALS